MSVRRHWPLVVFFSLSFVPLAWAIVYAMAYSLGLVGVLARGFTVQHWRAVIGGAETWLSFGYTFVVAGTVVGIAVPLALGAALTLGPRLDRGLASVAAHVPLAFPAAVTSLVVFRLFSPVGLVNDPWAIGIGMALLFTAVPFLALAFRAYYVTGDVVALEQVAVSLGASRVQARFKVSVPLMVRGCAATIALSFVLTFGAYEIPQLLGRQTPQMLSVLVMRKLARYDLAEKPQALAISVLYAVGMAAALLGVTRRARVARR